jgi:hypothetical protein
MHALVTSCFVFAVVFAGALAGMALRRVLPEEHLGTDAKETVRLAIGLVVTMTGLVLGLLVSSAKSYYDGQTSNVAIISSQIIELDELLTAYGPETKSIRVEAHQFVEDAADRIWPRKDTLSSQLVRPENNGRDAREQLQALVPKNEMQAAAKAQILSIITNLKRAYWLMFLESEQTSISIPLLTVVTLWLVAIFASFGVFAPPNATVLITLLICALAVSAAIFLILEMYSPFGGIMSISPAAIRDALNQMMIEP